MTAPRGRIDVHHHLFPPALYAALAAKGITEVASTPVPKWTPADSIAVMDANGIATALTSISAPGVSFSDRQSVGEACDLARACNEFAAEMAVKHPGRFGSFAVLPMPYTEHACKEAIYALDVLKADGVVLLGSTAGKFLGDPAFEDLMAELDRRKAIVFVHPNIHQTSTEIGLSTPAFIVEFLCDTTRAAVNLILTGTMERYPSIRWILSHAGGFLPYIAWRVSLANNFPDVASRAPQGVLTYIRRFYFDTALSPSPFALAALRELVEPSHILFGSDFPFAPAPLIGVEVENLQKIKLFDDATMAGIGRGHALGLFPQYAEPGETIMPHDIGAQPSNSRLNTVVASRAVRLVDWLRNR